MMLRDSFFSSFDGEKNLWNLAISGKSTDVSHCMTSGDHQLRAVGKIQENS